MKAIISSLVLLATTVLPLRADSPVPASSSIEIKMTKTEKKGQKPPRTTGNDCYSDRVDYLLEPTFRRGQNAKGSNLLLNIYIITTDSRRRMGIKTPFSQIIPNDPKVFLISDTSYYQTPWGCKCCRKLNIKGDPEWYAEVIKDGKVLCSAQSKLSAEINKLIEMRKTVSELNVKKPLTPKTP